MQLTPYVFFDGRCEEALAFYRKTLGAEVEMLLRVKEIPEPPPPGMLPPGSGEKVTHGRVRIGESTLLVSDGRCQGRPSFQGFALTLTLPAPAEAERVFAALSDGGKVDMPLGRTFFSPCFGTLTDRFGVSWMVYVAA